VNNSGTADTGYPRRKTVRFTNIRRARFEGSFLRKSWLFIENKTAIASSMSGNTWARNLSQWVAVYVQ